MDDFEEENIEKDIYTLRPSRGAFAPKNNSHPPSQHKSSALLNVHTCF